jgi:2-phosphosulfolactate phosphatase
MPKVHLLFKKEDLDSNRLQGKVVIVVDVLFATSTIVHALGRGIADIWPARDTEHAARIAEGLEAPLLAGEYLGNAFPGFASPMPLALADVSVEGGTLVYSTTNGTVALIDAAAAAHVYAGALLNGAALVAHVIHAHPQAQVLLVCSGSVDRFNLEDFYGAGHIAAHFERSGNYSLTDAATAALLLYRGCDADTVMSASHGGRSMSQHHLQHEVDCVTQLDSHNIVPLLSDGCLRQVA